MTRYLKDFPSGFFYIRSKEKPMAMDVNDGSMLNDAHIIIWPQKYVDSINQLWMHENGFLLNKKSGLALDIRGGDIKKDKTLVQYSRKPGLAHNQRWKFQDGFIFPAAAPHLSLDIRGGDYKEGNFIFLNTKTIGLSTQQWLIEPFENERSLQDLELLRPPVKLSTAPTLSPDDLYDCYRQVYRQHTPDPTLDQVAGAAAFQAIRIYLQQQKAQKQPGGEPKEALQGLVAQEVIRLLEAVPEATLEKVTREAGQAARRYYSREYELAQNIAS
ncbi:ricin B lectin domain-containing protein [Phycomyces nitens]|nr:ricin B lectin domain-containing protein [Phycomyces nitens]